MTSTVLPGARPTIDLPTTLTELADLAPSTIAERLGDAAGARAWLQDVFAALPAVLEPHIELSQLVVLLEQILPGAAIPGLMDVESAIAHGDWQTAYDICLAHTEPSAAALASLLLVVDGLNAAGESEAVLNLLNRALDLYEGTPAVYWAVIQVLTQQGRIDDAEEALILLREALQAA